MSTELPINAGAPIRVFMEGTHPCPAFVFVPFVLLTVVLIILLLRRVSIRFGFSEKTRLLMQVVAMVSFFCVVGLAIQSNRAVSAIEEAATRERLVTELNRRIVDARIAGKEIEETSPSSVALALGFPGETAARLDKIAKRREFSERKLQFDATLPE